MLRISCRAHVSLLVPLVTLLLLPAAQGGQDTWTGVERVVAVGDIHGDYDQFLKVLRSTRLVTAAGDWIGGKTHLVQVGDVLDRGPEGPKVLDLLMKLEGQARKAGGYVHALIGNHEAMNVYGDWRYVSAAEYAGFAAIETDQERQGDGAAGHPEGFTARQRLFSPEGRYGKWIRGHDTIVRIDNSVFVHAGLSGNYASLTLRQINDEVRAELGDFSKLKGGMIMDDNGPLWYRGLAVGDEAALAPTVDRLLTDLKAERIVVGHTPIGGAVGFRFSGKVALVDVGLSRAIHLQRTEGCLVIESGVAYAFVNGVRVRASRIQPEDGHPGDANGIANSPLELVAALFLHSPVLHGTI